MDINEVCPNVNENAMADESCGIVESKSSITMPSLSPYSPNERKLLRALFPPVTPDSNRETSVERNLRLNNILSPIYSHSNKPPSATVETPKDSVFDSFSPDSSKFVVAPYHGKDSEQFPVHAVRRRLSFEFDTTLMGDMSSSDDNCNDELNTEAEEQTLFELVCITILGAIVSEENDRINPNSATQVSDLDGFKTPDTVRRISGVAEACPGAPRKAVNQLRRHINKDVCRKLEF